MRLLTLDEFASLGRTTHDTLSITIDFDTKYLGKIELQTESAIRHVMGLARPEDGVEEIEWSEWDTSIRRYSEQILRSDSSGKQHDLYLLFLSGFIHEMRHAHDLLGSCYGQDFLFRLLNCYQNVPYLLKDLERWQAGQGEVIPVPLSDSKDFLPLSTASKDVLKRYREVLASLRQAQQPRGVASWLTPIDILETSACNVQMAFLVEVFGSEHAFRVAQHIASSPTADRYLRARNSVFDYLNSRGFDEGVASEAINYLTWASLMVVAPKGQSIASGLNPAIAFVGFVEQLARKRHKLGVEESISAVTAFCEEWGLRTPSEMSVYYMENIDRRLDSIPASADKLFRECHIGLKESFMQLQGFIERLPQNYFNGNAYPWSMIGGNFPSVKVRTRAKRQMEDFMSPGVRTISPDNWNFVDAAGCTLRVLSEGFGSLGDHELENLVIDALRKNENHQFVFSDAFFHSNPR